MRPPVTALALALLASGCAKRVWTPARKPVGKAREIPLDDPLVQLEADVQPSSEGVAVALAVTEAPQVRVEQTWRSYEQGVYDAKDAHFKGNVWIGAGLIAGLIPCFLAVPDEQTGERMMEPGAAALASLGVMGSFALVGGTQHLAPSLPPASRNGERSVQSSVVTRAAGPAADARVVVRGDSGEVAAGSTDADGALHLDLGMPADTLLLVEVDGQPIERFDLRGMQAWQLQQRTQVLRLMQQGRFDEARRIVTEVNTRDDGRWADYCRSWADTAASLDLAARTAALAGAPNEGPDCGPAWADLDQAWAAELATVARTASPDAWAEARSTAALPAGATPHLDALGACVDARATDDVELAYPRLERLADSAPAEGAACAEAARKAMKPAYDRAVAARERAERAAELAEQRAEQAALAAFRRQPSTWAGRIQGALATCKRFHSELDRRRSRIYDLTRRYDPRAETEAQALEEWVYAQQEGAMGQALETLRTVMEEMEEHESEGESTERLRIRLAMDAERYCSGG